MEIREVDFDMPIDVVYAYDGYGRLARMIGDRISGDVLSNYKVFLGSPRKRDKGDPDEKHILFTMFEANRIPDYWVEACNEADAIIVPSDFCIESFKASGVTTPLYKLHLGTDCFDVVNPPAEPFTFAHQNSFIDGDQKGWALVLKAFMNVFHKTPKDKVRLVLKGREHRWALDQYYLNIAKREPNVKVIIKDLTDKELEKWWESINCFVYPSRGEGFGLPPLEAMARGIPTILTNAHSMTEFAEYGIPIGTRGKCDTYYVGRVWHRGIGKWVEPDYAELEEQMWEVYNNYQEHKREALQNVHELQEKFSWDTVVDNLINTVEKIKGDLK